jgi:hypothetical protein
MTMSTNAHRLYTLAEQADRRFSETVKSRTYGKRDRWTMTGEDLLIPEVREAYRAKVNADEAWLTFLRTSRVAG